MVQVDVITAVRETRSEVDQLWAAVTAGTQPYNTANGNNDNQAITVVAFRGQNRSEAQYMRSNDASLTTGTGVVAQLSLMVAFSRGAFAGFQWYNQGPCDGCGGLKGANCVQSQYAPQVQQYPESSCASERGGRAGVGRGPRGRVWGWGCSLGQVAFVCVPSCHQCVLPRAHPALPNHPHHTTPPPRLRLCPCPPQRR